MNSTLTTNENNNESNRKNISLLLLEEKKQTLKPTKTIVRKMPIISHEWEESAVENYSQKDEQQTQQSNNNEANTNSTDSTNHHDKTFASREFVNNLEEQKQSLKPTTTIVKLPESPIEIVDLGFGKIAIVPKSSVETILKSEVETRPIEYLIPEKGWREMHGFLGDESWCPPRKISHNENEARPGYSSRQAHEYEDVPEVLSQKVSLLAKLLQKSSNCLIYTGAGISTSSGINDYASQRGSAALTGDERPRLRSPYEAQPTIAHHGVVSMYKSNLVHYWVQQNHDGLPQKAGLPQHAINEIHGAWYDPSNPVVAMSGQLRTDLFQDLLMWEQKTDLTLSMGTTMCGMNSDRVFTTVANKGLQEWDRKQSNRKNKTQNNDQEDVSFIGGVIINLQQTQYDSISCLRIFCKLDKLMEMLLSELGLPPLLQISQYTPYNLSQVSGINTEIEDVYQVPYDHEGRLFVQENNQHQESKKKEKKRKDSVFQRIADTFTTSRVNNDNKTNNNETEENNTNQVSSPLTTTLDLRVGRRLKLVSGPHVGDEGEVIGKNREGHYRIQFMHTIGKAGVKKPFETIMGSWWVEAAVKGTVPTIPVVNCN